MMIFNVRNYLPDFTTEEEVKEELKIKLAGYLGSKYVSLVSNGTVALEVVLRACGLTRGTEVIVPDISFIATATAAANCGLIPVYADVSENYFGITLEAIEKSYNENVGAVILVHFAGIAHREILAIKQFCEAKGIYLIEDCAQALPCEIEGNKAGTIGDAGTCSFQTSKIINSGEGGMITTNSEKIAERCEAILNWGLSFPGMPRDLDVPSSNFRMGAIQAYFVIKQMEMIDEIVSERNSRCDEFKKLCEQLSLEHSLPAKKENYRDCPFFFPLKSKVKHYTNEPRPEYPMRDSRMVKAIINRFHPDLMNRYVEVNSSLGSTESASDRVVRENDFINIMNSYKTPPGEMLKKYL